MNSKFKQAVSQYKTANQTLQMNVQSKLLYTVNAVCVCVCVCVCERLSAFL